MLCQIGFQNAGPYSFVGYDRCIEIGVTRPMIAMGFSVNDVPQLSMLFYLRFPFQCVRWLLRTVDHHDPIRGGDKTVVATPHLSFREDIAGNLLQDTPRLPGVLVAGSLLTGTT
jgi:hypothetical protein